MSRGLGDVYKRQAKGGVVLAIKDGLGIPVKYIGVGEQIDDLQPFNPDAFADALFSIKE